MRILAAAAVQVMDSTTYVILMENIFANYPYKIHQTFDLKVCEKIVRRNFFCFGFLRSFFDGFFREVGLIEAEIQKFKLKLKKITI